MSRPAPPLFAVAPGKLLLMSVCSLGLYQIAWFYQHWRHIKRRDGSRISAPWRSVLGLLFCAPLLWRIDRDARAAAVAGSSPWWALPWLLLSLTSWLPGLWSLLVFASPICLLPAQAAANRLNTKLAPEHGPNSGYSGWNIALIVVGGTMLLLVVLGNLLWLLGG